VRRYLLAFVHPRWVDLRMSDADLDVFIRNRSTVVAALRAGIAVFQPQALLWSSSGPDASQSNRRC
jgi:hypothetical protein